MACLYNLNLLHLDFKSGNIKFLSIPYKGCPFNSCITGNINITHTCLIKFKSMLQAGIVLGVLGFAPMIFTLLLS